MNRLVIILSVVFLALSATKVHSEENNTPNIDELTKEAELLFSTNTPEEDDETKKARLSALKAYYSNLERFYQESGAHRKNEWDHRLESFEWHYWTSVLIFVVVIVLMLSGLYFSYLQFVASEYGEKEGSDHRTQFKISKDGIEINSSVIGMLILFLSLGFFYLYLKEVYPLQTIRDGTQIDNQVKKSSTEKDPSNNALTKP